ncbi:MAG: serine/threonine protein kinase [Planctomycetales bacterium]
MARIGNYKMGKLLGTGTVGTVYQVTDRTTGQQAAMKILLPQISTESTVARRFEREMSILQRLDHRHIVRYLTDGTNKGRLYYVMEHVDSGSLKDELIIKGRLHWIQVCRYGIQICSALQHAHNHGIIHRDLKPANLFMTEAGQLKLGDFGIARDTHKADLTDAGLTVGTYAYMAPEQIRADQGVSDKVDLYALGCLLYEMLTGRPPFEGANFAQIFDQHLQRDPPSVQAAVPECPAELDQMIQRLMAKSPNLRPFNARYVQGFLQELLLSSNANEIEILPSIESQSETGSQLSNIEKVSWTTLLSLLALVGVIVGFVFLARMMN